MKAKNEKIYLFRFHYVVNKKGVAFEQLLFVFNFIYSINNNSTHQNNAYKSVP